MATAFHIERAKVNGIMKCSRNSSLRMWAAVKLTPGPKHMIKLLGFQLLKFRLGGFHLRWWEPDCSVLDSDCCYGCCRSCNRGSCMRRGSLMKASSIRPCLGLQKSTAGSSSSILGSDSIDMLLGLTRRPYWRLWQYPLTGHERLLVTSLMNYFPWQWCLLNYVVTACLFCPVFQRDVVWILVACISDSSWTNKSRSRAVDACIMDESPEEWQIVSILWGWELWSIL